MTRANKRISFEKKTHENFPYPRFIKLFLSGCAFENDIEITPIGSEKRAAQGKHSSNIRNFDFFYFDNDSISLQTFETYLSNKTHYHLVLIREPGDVAEVLHSKYFLFSTKSEMHAFGDKLGYPFRQADEADELINSYVKDHGLEAIQDIEDVPSDFYSFSSSVYKKLVPTFMPASLDKFVGPQVGLLYKDCVDGGVRPAFAQMPVMVFGWNNEVSRVDRLSVMGWTRLYDRSWYRDLSVNVLQYGFGQDILDFCPGRPLFFFNDRLSSAMFL